MSGRLRRLLPPVVGDAVRWVRDRLGNPEWRAVPDGFATAARRAGWSDPSIVLTQARRWDAFVARAAGRDPLGVSGEIDPAAPADDAAHNTVMVFAYALARAAHALDRVSLLDWGGGLGHYGILARTLLPEVTLDYHCRDLPGLVARGRTLFPDGVFHDDDACLSRRYDLVVASSSLQYHEHWHGTLAALARATRRLLLVTRLPTVTGAPGYVAVQRAHRHGYETELTGWVLNRDELLGAAAASGLALEREFLIQERPRIVGAPAPCRYRGFLFRPETSRADPGP